MPKFTASQRFRAVDTLSSAGCVFAEEEAQLLISVAKSSDELSDMVRQRTTGLPLEQVLGFAQFFGQHVFVGPNVFIPRLRTEYLVRLAIKLTSPGATILDLGCGTGAIALAIASRVDNLKIFASDIEPTAIVYARRNLSPIGGQVYEGDLFKALPTTLRGQINTLVANVPYVPTRSVKFLPREARVYEPLSALDGGEDGLDIQRRVAEQVFGWLAPGGSILFESSEHQSHNSQDILNNCGLSSLIEVDDELDAHVIIGTKPE